MKKNELMSVAFKETVSIFIGYLFLGIGFGILFKEAGGNWLQAFFTSLLIYAGSMQYALAGLLREHVSLITVALTTLAVNGRYFFYGLSILDRYQEAGRYKPFLLFWLSDETFALVSSDPDTTGENRFQKWFYISGLDYAYWVFSCTLGALLGNVLPFSSKGIEFVMTALFTTIFIDQWMRTNDHLPALSGLGITALCLFVLPRQNFLLISLIILTLFLTLYGKRKRV